MLLFLLLSSFPHGISCSYHQREMVQLSSLYTVYTLYTVGSVSLLAMYTTGNMNWECRGGSPMVAPDCSAVESWTCEHHMNNTPGQQGGGREQPHSLELTASWSHSLPSLDTLSPSDSVNHHDHSLSFWYCFWLPLSWMNTWVNWLGVLICTDSYPVPLQHSHFLSGPISFHSRG